MFRMIFQLIESIIKIMQIANFRRETTTQEIPEEDLMEVSVEHLLTLEEVMMRNPGINHILAFLFQPL